LEGNIIGGEPAITYYNDPHDGLFGTVDFVMANPPFNVDEVDAEKVKNDRRLPFGLPGINKNKKVPNANYLWIQYFYSYLNKTGRAGFVMSSQASSAGREEAKVREQLVRTGHVEAMVDIRGNFFYTRTVPCQLWFFNKAKPQAHQDKMLMIDARNVYRKVTRKIMDFSPEQLQNLSAIVWLYRGQEKRFVEQVKIYLNKALNGLNRLFLPTQQHRGLAWFMIKLQRQLRTLDEFKSTGGLASDEVSPAFAQLRLDVEHFKAQALSFTLLTDNVDLTLVKQRETALSPLSETSRDLVKSVDHIDKQIANLTQQAVEQLKEQVKSFEQALQALVDESKQTAEPGRLALLAEQEKELKEQIKQCNQLRSSLQRNRKPIEQWRKHAVEQLKEMRYFYKQAHWLLSRFPDGKLADVQGLVKLVDIKYIEAADWSLTPGRYVGVAPEEVDEDFDFEEALRDIHIELKGLNEEAVVLAAQIAANFEELGI